MSSFGRPPPSPSSDDVIYEQPLKLKQFRFQPLEFRSDWFWFVLLILYSISGDINLHSPQKCFETWTIVDQLNWINLQVLRETNQALDLISHSSHLWGYRTWTGQKSEDRNREIYDLKVWGVKRQKPERWKRWFSKISRQNDDRDDDDNDNGQISVEWMMGAWCRVTERRRMRDPRLSLSLPTVLQDPWEIDLYQIVICQK